MSELREVIAMKYKAVVFDEWNYDDFVKNGLDSFVDSTLDAVIASLDLNNIPNDKELIKYSGELKGYYSAQADMLELLQSAKSISKESDELPNTN